MILMLVLVTCAEEAEVALRHGTDIIDLKGVAGVFGFGRARGGSGRPDAVALTIGQRGHRRTGVGAGARR